MAALSILVFGYVLVVMMGKVFFQKRRFIGYLFVAFISALQVGCIMYYMYSMEVPIP